MAYSIHKADGTLVSVPENAIDTSYYNPSGGGDGTPGSNHGMGIQLIGRNAIDYGAPVAQSFLQLTENFSSVTGTQPLGAKALQGQLWFDKALATLYVRITPGVAGADALAANWAKLVTVPGNGNVVISNPAPGTERDGDIQVIPGPPLKINIWGVGAWHQVFPSIAVYS